MKDYFLKGQTGLQILVPLYTDEFLKIKGKVGMVLPETILSYTDTTGFQEFFKKFYQIEYIISSEVEISFSESCDWKDFLFIAKRFRNYRKYVIPKMTDKHYNKIEDLPEYFIKFILLKTELTVNNYKNILQMIRKTNKNLENDDIKIILINSKDLDETNQWVRFFRRDLTFNQFINYCSRYLIQGTKIFKIQRRGFYIYGKNFFFLPNKYWDIIDDETNFIIIQNRDTLEKLQIDKKILKRTLRSPALHHKYVIPESDHYVLFITIDKSKLTNNIKRYIKWSKILNDKEISARKNNPKSFYKFTGEQIKSSPFGRIIIPEKYKPVNRGVSSHILDDIIVPVSYYTKSTGDNVWDKLICAWLNSSIGILIRYNARVILGSASERLNGEQINQLNFPNIKEISDDDIENILKNFIIFISNSPLPTIKRQLTENYRKNLDEAFLNAFKYPKNLQKDLLDYIYTIIEYWANT